MSIPAFAWAMEQGRRLKLSVAERMLLLTLADHANGKTGLCCPGQETLADDTGLTSRHIRDLTQGLEERGLISVQKIGRTCHYKLVRANGADPEPAEHRKPVPVSAATPEPSSSIEQDDSPKYRKSVPPSEGDTGNPRTEYRNSVPFAYLKTQPRKITKEGKNTPTPHGAGGVTEPPGFLEFWTDYPRKVGKRAAATAFAAAVKRGTHPDDILDGLDRARPKMELLDERYRPHPTTWLNQDRWHDEPDTVDPVLRALGLVPEDMATGLFAGLQLQ